MDKEEYIKMIHLPLPQSIKVSIYYDSYHKDIKHFVDDMESRGFPTMMIPHYFPVIMFGKYDIVEVIGYDKEDKELVINTVFKDGHYCGHSQFFEE